MDGVWRFEAIHPEWTEEDAGEDGWDPLVGWWAVSTQAGLLLIDPLIDDWPAIDQLVEENGGCAGIIRTILFHQRTIAEAASRYSTEVWARRYQGDENALPFDRELTDGEEPFEGVTAHGLERVDEIAVWLARQRALIFGDAMLRSGDGELRICPDSWDQPPGGPAHVRALLRELTELPVEHVLVSHGPLVLGDGFSSLRAATG
jgi:glyoxylase-like metal-dependent hydrolase (beta-lactamase superfamily II)